MSARQIRIATRPPSRSATTTPRDGSPTTSSTSASRLPTRAQTNAELQRLLADLPVLPEVRKRQERVELVERRAHLQRRLIQQTGGSVIAFAVCTGIWVASGASGSFWPIWVALIAVIGLLKSGWDLYGPAPDLDAVENRLEPEAGPRGSR